MKRYPKRTASKSSKDPVIEEMEKFMKETENVGADSLTVSKGKLYDTENLLHILGSKTTPENACVGCTPPPEKPKMRVLPKRRKTQERSEEPPPKKTRTTRMTKKNIMRLKFAQGHTVKCEMCEKMAFPRRRKASRIYYSKNHKAKLVVVDIRNDSKIVRNDCKSVKVKREVEVIDLTVLDGNSCYMLVNFAQQREVEEVDLEICARIAPAQYQRAVVSGIAAEKASTTVPDVRDDLSLPVVDLTVDEEKPPPVTISEKEFANTILPMVYQFHEMTQLIQEAEKSLEDCSFTESSKIMGYQLVQTLSDVFVKNINMSRFLEILVTKIEEKYNLLLGTTTAAYYLKVMFEENRQYCKNKLTQNFLREIDNYYTDIKSESVPFTQDSRNTGDPADEVFTQDQLKQLVDQIRQYHELLSHPVIILVDEDTTDCAFSWTEEKVEIQ